MSAQSASQLQSDLRDVVAQEMERWGVPGVAVAVLDRDRIQTACFGVANVETSVEVTPDTLFRIGSITKTFTATLVMTLVGEGLLDLDAPVIRYLPGIQLAETAALQALTVRHLLTHTGGFEGDYFEDTGQGDDALERYVDGVGALRQLTAPGELWSYSNSGFALAGHIVATVLGQPYEQAMRERVLAPLGMDHSVLSPAEAIVYPVAVGHAPGEGGPEVVRSYTMPRSIVPAGGIISTVDDLAKYATLHMQRSGEGSILSAEAIRAMHEPQIAASNFCDAVGLAWMIRYLGDTTVIEHGGDWKGLQAQLTIVPEHQLAITVLTNSSQGSALYRSVTDFLLERYRGLRHENPQRISMRPNELYAYAGVYLDPLGRGTEGHVTSTGAGLTLTISVPGMDPPPFAPMLLTPIGPDRFFIPDGVFNGLTTDFVRDGSGGIRFLRFAGRLASPADPASGV